MNTKDFMLNDWVYSKRGYGTNGDSHYARITSLSDAPIPIGVAFPYKTTRDAEELEPIPLTAEMLEKNGFEFRLDCLHLPGYATIEKRGSGFLVRCRKYDFENEVSICIRLYYVHELQHALRLCGLNDLADNFKVE